MYLYRFSQGLESLTSNTEGQLRNNDSINFVILKHDTIGKALGKDKKSLEENFIHTKQTIGDNLELFTKKTSPFL